MSDTVKLIVTLSKGQYENLKDIQFGGICSRIIFNAVKNGIPLDNIDSNETKAYFDGQAYGWEQGRKALIDEVKAEIEKHQFSREYCINHNIDTAIDMGMVRIILDSIDKGDSE